MRCPVCRADNSTGPQCRRCRADLSLLFQLEEQRERLRAQANVYAARGDGCQVVAMADALDRLRHGEEVDRLRAIGALLQRDFAVAWQHYVASRERGSANRG